MYMSKQMKFSLGSFSWLEQYYLYSVIMATLKKIITKVQYFILAITVTHSVQILKKLFNYFFS